MSQNDFSLANDTGANFRADANAALQALASISSGGSAPGTPYSYQPWADTTSGVVKRRNAANSGWLLSSTLAETFVVGKSGSYTVAITDFGTWLTCTSTFTLALTAAATLGDGFWVGVRNDGSGVITIDPNSTEQVDGASTLALYPGESCQLVCTGSAWKTFGLAKTSVKVLQLSRDISLTSSMSVTGAGFRPREVFALAGVGAGTKTSWGFSDGTTLGCIYDNSGSAADTRVVAATVLVVLLADGSNYSSVTGVTFTDDGATLTWSKTGSPTGTADIMLIFRR